MDTWIELDIADGEYNRTVAEIGPFHDETPQEILTELERRFTGKTLTEASASPLFEWFDMPVSGDTEIVAAYATFKG